ncbi:acyl-CoA dehydrogenase [Kitasatospora kifunensis]|uniref:Alkylation response protein AidB-like acyl-CoA dehydrogenase n=1 Tax=Kitasatospora kifunensis TaxID=58351 RepID=A0A7W7R461_KITKI|nr:acyl-CoA dehydrogenase [Kitasatospora kifunensis]MBB4924859.1 alkylation response protein AidB-like acyl-CoA dehydrogenase [Kitasatospora kifunensis]
MRSGSVGADTAAAADAAGPEVVTVAESEVRRRVAELERCFGDPADPANPLGSAAFLAADEREEPLAAAELLLERFGLNAEFVPSGLGGRLVELDTLARVVRVVFRRDAALGLGYGFSNFLAAVVVWAAGRPEQQRAAADLLQRGRRLAAAYPELARGSNFLANELTAVPQVAAGADSPGGGAGVRLSGRKDSFTNVERAGALVLFVRVGEGRRSHSVLLVDRAELPADRVAELPRRRTRGVRGCLVAGIEFTDCPVPAAALLGEPGRGLELALRVFPVIRSAGPSVALGCADTALRTAVACAVDRGTVGRDPVAGQGGEQGGPQPLSHARSTLAGAFVDLLLCDCLALVATRAVHLVPGDAALYAAAVKYLLPQLLTDTSYELSTLLGAEFHAHDGAYGAFRKSVRDLPMIGLGAAGSAAFRATVVPQLPRLARESWFLDAEPPTELFQLEAGRLPPLDFGLLTPAAGADPLAASLLASAAALAAPCGDPAHTAQSADRAELAELVSLLVAELTGLRDGCADLDRDGRSALADPRGRALADRYALVLAGAACLGVWRGRSAAGAGFLADPGWAVAALTRLLHRLGTPTPKSAVDRGETLLAEVLARFRRHRSYDLYDTPLAGGMSTQGDGRDC